MAAQQIITKQQQAIRELSSPILELQDGLLIAPLVGAIDTIRARDLTEQLLRTIGTRRARVVVDVTGVPVIDSASAGHLIQTAQAARLMGQSSS